MTLPLPCTLKGRKGRYQVASKLTDGGMSTVYLGKSSRGQAVVVKEASGPDLEQADERLRIEADILKALASPGHPRVVRYLDEGTNLGPFCLIEEKLEGDTLSERYRDKAADVDTATRYILQLLEALAYLHGRNVIHRDVKPNNIILDVNREVVLIDFGAAKKEFHQFMGSDRHLHARLGGTGAEPGRGHSGERSVRRRRGLLLPPDRPGSPGLDETARGREDGTLPIPPRPRSPRHAGDLQRGDEGHGLRSKTAVSDGAGHGRGDRGRVGEVPGLSAPCGPGEEMPGQEGD